MTSTIQSFAQLSDDELLATVKHLALTERRATAALVRSLMELDLRRLYLGEGYLVATLRPMPAVDSTVRKLPEPEPRHVQLNVNCDTSPTAELPLASPTVVGPPVQTAPPTVTPLAPKRYKVQFTISGDTHEKLRRVQALARHAIPSGDPAEIFDRALTLLLQALERRRCAAVTSPREARRAAGGSRHIPAQRLRGVTVLWGRARAHGWDREAGG
jgi:hypothetical protein